ncbi:MAG: hypothetical protein K6V73_05830 [Firmicutes bacterium]|nr:hypothetical protein [Bacillota bacterium]
MPSMPSRHRTRRGPALALAALVASFAAGAGASAASTPPPSPPLYPASAYQGAAHLRHFVALARAHPKNLTDQFEAAVASFQNARPRQAIAYYLACVRLDPSFAEAYNDIGNVYRESLGNTKAALAYYLKATQVNPGYPFGWLNLGFVYQSRHQDARAAQAYLAAARHDPGYDGTWDALVGLYVADKEHALAQRYARQALKALPKGDPSRPYLEKVARGR